MSDSVNHPDHYRTESFECIDVMEEVFGVEAVQTFCRLNAFKYLWRADQKNGMEDIDKAAWYLNTLQSLEKEKDYKDDPEDDKETPNLADVFSDLIHDVGDIFKETRNNILDFANPNSDHRKRIEYFNKLKEEGYSEDVAFYFAAFKDLPEDKDEQ